MRADEDTMRDEYDFSHARRNPYAKLSTAKTNLVLIEPELFALFPSSEAVNDALRSLARAEPQSAEPQTLEHKAS